MKKKILESAGAAVAHAGERKGTTGRLSVRLDPKAEWSSVLKGLKGFVLQRLRIAAEEGVSAAEVRRLAAMKGSPFVGVEEERVVRPRGKKSPGDDAVSTGRQKHAEASYMKRYIYKDTLRT